MVMPDRLDVITGLEAHKRMRCSKCPYYIASDDYCHRNQLFDDAIALLDVPEVKPVWTLGYHRDAYCGSCKAWLPNRSWTYCPRCGRKVMWDV